ncbi:hypothetical protein Ddye_021405 [Dipteronia dyeriana]|uniref:DNA ligase n=1 Tax=Dipteronia dyeriana TaxID=168575 RepID=A0AAD9U2M5_9ROSI|nr:hypothetical protein Ddye_021405 [Dipteronia dyeriana]
MAKTEDVKFSVLVSLFNWIQKTKPPAKKRSKFRKFLDTYCESTDYFTAVRLILPSLDRERGSYGLKEHVLATYLVDALGMSKDSQDAIRLKNWRKDGGANNAGNFPMVAAEVLQRRQGMISGGLTIKELNDLLDLLASGENRAEKIVVLSTLIKKTNAQEMKWIIMIILKDLKLGISEKSIFHEFHPDAEDLFNVTCDLKLVCEKLRDRRQRHKRQDIEVGKAVRPQLAMRVGDAHAAWKKLHGKEVVVECKFDGDRIQIHKNGADVHYFSRNYLDHSEYGHAMSTIFAQNILVDRCILDGEMLVWDTSLNRFAEFGSNQEIAKAAREGLASDRQLCYVAFDILYVRDTSIIHQSLKERHELLRKVVKPLKGRLEILVPNGGLNTHRTPGEPCWSLIAHNVDDVEKFFKETIENRDEGIVLKDLGSKWEPSDRSGKWLKLKPDYVRCGSDLDVLIIGGYYGSGRRGGEVAQFLVALAESSASKAYPRRFISFCRVGTGLSDEELDAVVTKLKPYFRKYEYPKKAPPTFYQVTNNSKERPDVWIESPEISLILSITSDIRTIRSEVFAAPYSLRFPRIDKVRYDKPWHECLDVQSFVELVHSSNGTTQKGKEYGGLQYARPKVYKSSRKGEKKNASVVPSHFIQTDVSNIKGETLIFSKMVFYFVNVRPTHSLDSLHRIVVENGGMFSMNLNNSVTHCAAAENKGIKYQAAKRYGDVIHYSWVLDCCSQKKLLQLQPKYFLYLSDSSKSKLQEVDEFSDSYFWDLDLADIKQLLSNIDRLEDSKTVDYYKKKYYPRDKWCCFHGCCIYFFLSTESLIPEEEVLLGLGLRRLKLEVSFGGGKVCCNLSNATHLVVLSVPGCDLNFESLIKSFNAAEKHLFLNKKLHVVGSQWLEDCLEREQKMEEYTYSLKPSETEKLYFELCQQDLDMEEASNLETLGSNGTLSFPDIVGSQGGNKVSPENPKRLASPKREDKRKRGRPVGGSTKKGKISVNHARRTRAHVGKKPLKIYENESDEGGFCDEKGTEDDIQKGEGNHDNHGLVNKENLEVQQYEVIGNSESLQRGKAYEQEVAENDKQVEFVKTPEIEMVERYDQDTEKPEWLEVTVDPVQAMLLDMIPSLGMKKAETIDPILKEKLPADPTAGPSKKKKVSYKDIAGELLKDW